MTAQHGEGKGDAGPAHPERSGSAAANGRERISRRRVLSAYKQMLLSLFLATLIVIGALIVLNGPFYYMFFYLNKQQTPDPPLLAIIVLAGSLGAFFSALMRLYDFQDLPKALVAPELEGLKNRQLLVYSLVPAVVGAIAATVLYVGFASGLVQGDLFPEFVCKLNGAVVDDDKCASFMQLLGNWGPNVATDYAKAIIWGFIAGFAERFVPDTLLSLTKSAQSSHGGDEHQG